MMSMSILAMPNFSRDLIEEMDTTSKGIREII